MSPDDVAAKAKAHGDELGELECPAPWRLVPFQVLLRTTEKGTTSSKASYMFDARGLTAFVESGASVEVCDRWEAELSALYGVGEKLAAATDLVWKNPANGEGARLSRHKSGCERWTSSKAVVDAGYRVFTGGYGCVRPLELVERQSGDLSKGDSCTSTTEIHFAARPLRIEKEMDLHFWMYTDEPAAIEVFGPTGETVTEAETKKDVGHEANFRQKLSPGCYIVQINAKEPKKTATYRLEIEPYADWKANEDLEQEEKLGEEPDEGPPTAEYPAIILGGATPYYGGTTHINVAGMIGLVDAGNMMGMNTQIGFELTRHPRVRPMIGGSVGVLYQRLDDQWSTTNTMLPVSLWGGARASVAPKLLAQARLGLLGYYISADADEQMLGAYDRSETGGGYVFGLDLMYGPLVVGLEQMFLATGVTTFRLGFGF